MLETLGRGSFERILLQATVIVIHAFATICHPPGKRLRNASNGMASHAPGSLHHWTCRATCGVIDASVFTLAASPPSRREAVPAGPVPDRPAGASMDFIMAFSGVFVYRLIATGRQTNPRQRAPGGKV
jgi:hypothetical protein